MMTDHIFNNGVKIHIPDSRTRAEEIERWTHAKMIMSILLRPDEQPMLEQPTTTRKPYTWKDKEGTMEKRSKIRRSRTRKRWL